jgi:hypothetical protein
MEEQKQAVDQLARASIQAEVATAAVVAEATAAKAEAAVAKVETAALQTELKIVRAQLLEAKGWIRPADWEPADDHIRQAAQDAVDAVTHARQLRADTPERDFDSDL